MNDLTIGDQEVACADGVLTLGLDLTPFELFSGDNAASVPLGGDELVDGIVVNRHGPLHNSQNVAEGAS
jgi:hypothetical protein